MPPYMCLLGMGCGGGGHAIHHLEKSYVAGDTGEFHKGDESAQIILPNPRRADRGNYSSIRREPSS